MGKDWDTPCIISSLGKGYGLVWWPYCIGRGTGQGSACDANGNQGLGGQEYTEVVATVIPASKKICKPLQEHYMLRILRWEAVLCRLWETGAT